MKRELFCQVLRIYLCNLQVTIINCGVQGEYKDKILRYINHILYEDKIGIHLYFMGHSLSLLDRMEQLCYLSISNKVFYKEEFALKLSLQGLLAERKQKKELSEQLWNTVNEFDTLDISRYKHYNVQFLFITSYQAILIAIKRFLTSYIHTLCKTLQKFQLLYTDIINMYLHLYAVEFIMDNTQRESYTIKSRKIRRKLQSTLRLFWQLWNTIITEHRLYYSNMYKNNRRLSNKGFKNSGIYILWKICVVVMEPWKIVSIDKDVTAIIAVMSTRYNTLKLKFINILMKRSHPKKTNSIYTM